MNLTTCDMDDLRDKWQQIVFEYELEPFALITDGVDEFVAYADNEFDGVDGWRGSIERCEWLQYVDACAARIFCELKSIGGEKLSKAQETEQRAFNLLNQIYCARRDNEQYKVIDDRIVDEE